MPLSLEKVNVLAISTRANGTEMIFAAVLTDFRGKSFASLAPDSLARVLSRMLGTRHLVVRANTTYEL